MPTRFLAIAFAFFQAICVTGTALASGDEGAYPSKPIRLVVPFPPGGATDAIARVVSAALSLRLKQPVIVDNRPGAGGNIGAEQVAKASPDGYTLLLGTISTNAINESLYHGLPFSAQRDLKPVAALASLPLVLITSRPEINSVEDLTRLARQAPGSVTYASSGSGTASHLAAKMFELAAHITMTHVPYKGSAAALTDVMAQRVDVTFDTVVAALAHIKSGRLKALAVTTQEPVPFLDKAPPISKSGVPGFKIDAWNGIFAPKGTPAAPITILGREIRSVLADPAVKQRILGIGGVVLLQDERSFSSFVKAEHDKYRELIQRSGISID